MKLICHDFAAGKRSYALLAESFGLPLTKYGQ